MRTFQVRITHSEDYGLVKKILESLEQRKIVTFEESDEPIHYKEAEPASDEDVQKIIDEAELAPYYSEKEARDILDL